MRRVRIQAALVAAFFMGGLFSVPVAPPALLASCCAHASPLAGDPSMPAAVSNRQSAVEGAAALAGRADTLSIARRHLGTNPTGRRSLWCADFVNLIERRAGRAGTGSRMARAFLGYGRPVRLADARAGDIVVLGRRGGGHVGYLVSRSGGTVRLISGNACSPRRVCESTYPASRILGIRRP